MAVPDAPRALWRMLIASKQQRDAMIWYREHHYVIDGVDFRVDIKYDFAGDFTRTLKLNPPEKELVAKFRFYTSYETEFNYFYKIYHLTLRSAAIWPDGYNHPKHIMPIWDERTYIKYPTHFRGFGKRELYHHLMMITLNTDVADGI